MQILSKDLLEHRCPILQSGFLPNVLTPQIPGGEFCSPTSLGLGDKSKNSFFLCPSRRAIPNAATALSFLLGPQDWAHPTRTGQGARAALSSHPSQHDKALSTLGTGVCFNHSCPMSQTFWPCCCCSHYCFECWIFCTFSSSITLIITLNIPGTTGRN